MERLFIYTDGASRGNPGPAAVAFIISDSRGRVLLKGSKFLGIKTNNEAEYLAVIEALGKAKRFKPKEVVVTSDSELVINQLRGSYKIKKAHLKGLVESVRKAERDLGKVAYFHSRRDNACIKACDRMVNRELDRQKKFV